MLHQKDIPFNMDCSYDQNLRELPLDPQEMQKGLEFCLEKLDTEQAVADELYRASILSLIGVYQRILGKFDLAENALKEAISFFHIHNASMQEILVEARLATNLQWKGNHIKARSMIERLLLKVQKNKKLKKGPLYDILLIHLAKCKFDQREYKGCIDLLTDAMDIRVERGEIKQIDHVTQMIGIARQKLPSLD